jgi:Cupin-like domain
MSPVEIRTATTAEQFHREVRPAGQPVLMKGLVKDWPIVAAANAGDEALAQALAANASPEPLVVSHAPHGVGGKFHYADGGSQLNFERTEMPLARFLSVLLAERDNPEPRALAAQGQNLDRIIPQFGAVHPVPVLPPGIPPRMWIGSASTVATHGDDLENVACVAAGHRRFTLFPPEQIGNLYLGPFELTPGGTPISMVDAVNPDLARYPRFIHAMEAAQVAELEPGDALYIPYQWYHHVQALDPINVLVNYWWSPSRAELGSNWDALLHGMITLRCLPVDQRRAWKALFDHYVFLENGDPAAHLEPEVRGVMGELTKAELDRLMADLRANLDPANEGKVGPLK